MDEQDNDSFINVPLENFLGLSLAQMSDILYADFDELSHIVCCNDAFDPALLKDVEVVKKIVRLIQFVGEAGEVRATQNGYLPKKIVNELGDTGDGMFILQSEVFDPRVTALRKAATTCGWIKKSKGRFSLTRKGKQIFENGFSGNDYLELLFYWMGKANWAFSDRYPESQIIQRAVIFCLYLLLKIARSAVAVDTLCELFFQAFPTALVELAEELIYEPDTPEKYFHGIFQLRFVERFAAYFGLVEFIVDEKLDYLERLENLQVRTTPLFSAVFHWTFAEGDHSSAIH